MRVALVHELLTMKGGAERVLRVFARMFPDAPIYTLLYDESLMRDWFPKERVRPSHVQQRAYRLPPTAHRYNHHLYLRAFPQAVEAWDFSDFDLVLSSSSAFAHGIITNGNPKHVSYVHAPARYLWDRTQDVIERAPAITRPYLRSTFHQLRTWDSEAADRADTVVAASRDVQRRIELYWRRHSEVLHPPIADHWFTPRTIRNSQLATRNYFLVVSTLAPYKRIDLAIEACNAAKLPLKIVGSGPARASLERLAGPTIEFLGYREQEELKAIYAGAKALIVPGEEDFGLAAVESLACGIPVVAYKSGGLLETVSEGETGTFFERPEADALRETLLQFDHKKYSAENCRLSSEKFSESNFEHQIRSIIEQTM